MILQTTRGLRRFAVALIAAGTVAFAPTAGSAQTVERVRAPAIEVPDVDVDVPRIATPKLPGADGSLVFHGNYCGPGSRGPGLPPVDALDAACMRHDACSPAIGEGLPSCGCNARLQREASLVARNPRTPDDERVAAQFVAEGAKVLACR